MTDSEMPRPTDCPDLEQLASFVDGRLDAGERERLIRHLADCDACREIVAESMELANELGRGGSEVAPLVRLRPSRVKAAGWLAAAGVAGIALVWMLSPRANDTTGAIAELAGSSGGHDLPADWSAVAWPVMRSDEQDLSDVVRSFRLGVRTVDLEVAAARSSGPDAWRAAEEIALTLRGMPFSDSVVNDVSSWASKTKAAGSSSPPEWSEVDRIVRSCRELADEPSFDLGRWAEIGRLLALTGSSRSWPLPEIREGHAAELGAAAAAAARAQGDERIEVFARLVALGGGAR